MKTLAMVLTMFLLAGCESKPVHTYDDTLKTYVGKPKDAVLMSFGSPTQSYDSGSDSYLTYFFNGGSVMAPIGYSYVSIPRSCKTTFHIDGTGLVSDYRWEGNACN